MDSKNYCWSLSMSLKTPEMAAAARIKSFIIKFVIQNHFIIYCMWAFYRMIWHNFYIIVSSIRSTRAQIFFYLKKKSYLPTTSYYCTLICTNHQHMCACVSVNYYFNYGIHEDEMCVCVFFFSLFDTIITHNLRRRKLIISEYNTLEPVHAATTSWILQGVTTTINPNDIAAIVRDTEPLSRLSWKFIV